MLDFIRELVSASDAAILWYFIGINTMYASLLLLALPQLWCHWEVYTSDDLGGSVVGDALPPISVLVPAHDMTETILASVECLLSLRYPRHEVIVVNDGSRDDTMEKLRGAFDLYEVPPVFPRTMQTEPVRAYYRSRRRPELVVVDKLRGGKADAVNAAINVARHPLVLAVDADTLIEHDALLRLARPFILGRDVAAAGATIRVANGCTIINQCVREARLPRNWVAGIQVPEYLRAFLFGRLGWNPLGGSLIVSGAFGIFRRDYLLSIGGYERDSVGEDFELVVRLHRYLRRNRIPYRITFIPDPIAWTEVPSDLGSLGRQRERWHRGLATTLGANLKLLFNFRYGKLGLIAFPFFVFGELLAPAVEAYGLLILATGMALGALDPSYALAFFAAAWGYGTLITVAAVVMEEVAFARYERFRDFLRMLVYALCEPFGFRQLTVWWRLSGLSNALLGRRSWGAMRRRGFADVPAR